MKEVNWSEHRYDFIKHSSVVLNEQLVSYGARGAPVAILFEEDAISRQKYKVFR